MCQKSFILDNRSYLKLNKNFANDYQSYNPDPNMP